MERLRQENEFTFQYVSINTEIVSKELVSRVEFTFQYVSINTASTTISAFCFHFIYIPICFY